MIGSVKCKPEVADLFEKRRGQFVQAAIKLFGKQGYHVTTIRDIAVEVKVSIGLIYQYVDDKEDVLFLALLAVLDAYKIQVPMALDGVRDPLDRFCTAVHAYCKVNDENVNATVLAYRETKSLRKDRRALIQAKELETNTLIADCINDCIAVKVFNDIDVELLTYQLIMFSHAWALKAWHFRGMMTLDEYVDRGLALILSPVLTARGKRALPGCRETLMRNALGVKPTPKPGRSSPPRSKRG